LLQDLRRGLPALLEDSGEDGSAEEIQRVIDGLEMHRQSMSARSRLSLPDFLLGLPQAVGSSAQSAASSREGSVSLLTYHQAKGLEFAVVFLVALEAGIFPDFRSEKDLRRMEEERRLFYVGITRTKSRLYLTYSRQRRGVSGGLVARQPSPFLSEIPRHLIQRAPASTLIDSSARGER
jgi:DNA helicase-2/ATP-dependent DNA helicase PcrA